MRKQLSAKLITYNRAERLRATLHAWNNSEFKSISLEILDNASSDHTKAVIDEACAQNSNISVFRHAQNIGAIGNLLRAYERFNTAYCWVLCDDDQLNVQHAKEVFHLLKSEPDVLLVASIGIRKIDAGYTGSFKSYIEQAAAFFVQGAFLPALIFKRKFLDNAGLFKCYKASGCLYPHIALLDAIYKNAQSVSVLSHPVIVWKRNDDKDSAGAYWLFESLQPARYIEGKSREAWISQMLIYLRQDTATSYIKSAASARACGSLTFERAMQMNALVRPTHLPVRISLICVSITPRFIWRMALFLRGYRKPMWKEATLVTERM